METSDSPNEIHIDVTNMDVAENNQPMESEARMNANSDQIPTSGPLDRNDPHTENEESILRNLLNSIIPTDTVQMGAIPTVAVQAALNPAEPEVQGQRAIERQNARDTEEFEEWNANNNGNQDDFSSNPIVRRAVRCFVDERTSIYDYIANKRDHRGELITERCIMCQEDISTGETVRTLYCGHLFHDQCILPWLVTQLHCPVCRQSLTEIVLETDFTDSDQGFNGPVEFVGPNGTLRNRALIQILRQAAPQVQAQLRAEAQARAQAQAIAEAEARAQAEAIAEAQAIVQAQIRARVQEIAETRAIVGVRARTRARARARGQAVPYGTARARAQAIAETRATDQARARAQAQAETEAE